MYEEDVERESNNIDVFMTRLRRKLDPKDEIKPFETIRGRGWRFAIPRTTAPKE
jgi:two-component system response regulator PhoP